MPERKRGSKTDWARVDATRDEDIVYDSDAPDLGDDDEFWAQEPIRRAPKQAVSLRVDQDVLEWFKALGEGYQTRMNWALRLYMTKAHQAASRKAGAPASRRRSSTKRPRVSAAARG